MIVLERLAMFEDGGSMMNKNCYIYCLCFVKTEFLNELNE